MSLIGKLAGFALRHTVHESADKVVSLVDQHFSDPSQRLPKSLLSAHERAWQVVGLALAGDALFDLVKDLFRGRDVTALRDQLREFLAATPTGLEMSSAELRMRACEELTQLRKSGKLSAPFDLCEVESDIRRYGDPSKLVASAEQAVAAVAGALVVDAPHLAQMLRVVPAGGTPLLAGAFLYFFRREAESSQELGRALTFDSLRTLTAGQDRGFALLGDRTAGILDQFDVLFDALEDWFADTGSKLDDIRGKLDRLLADRKVTTSTADPLHLSVTNEQELEQLRRWREELRKLPPELLNSADWSKLGDAQAAGRLFTEAQESHQSAARSADTRAATAEAEFKVYRDACELEKWDDALKALLLAAELDPVRFAPFPLNRYEPVAVLGAGAFGTVIRCRQRLAKGREVAVKTFHSADLGRDVGDVFEEAHTLSMLAVPGIVKVVAWEYADLAETRPFIVMEYFAGVSLAQHLKRYGKLRVEEFVPLARQIAEAMAAAHTAGILHRDLKPGNILVRRVEAHEGSAPTWDMRVIDFGLAVRFAAIQASISTSLPHRTRRELSLAGTLQYAAPEQTGQLSGVRVGPYTDVYGFGRTCLEAVLATTDPRKRDWQELPEAVRSSLQELLERCTDRDPAHRYSDFGAVVTALGALGKKQKRRSTTKAATTRAVDATVAPNVQSEIPDPASRQTATESFAPGNTEPASPKASSAPTELQGVESEQRMRFDDLMDFLENAVYQEWLGELPSRTADLTVAYRQQWITAEVESLKSIHGMTEEFLRSKLGTPERADDSADASDKWKPTVECQEPLLHAFATYLFSCYYPSVERTLDLDEQPLKL